MRDAGRVEVLEDGGRIVGFRLEADYTSEHERGIGDIARALGIGAKGGDGLARRTAAGPVGVDACRLESLAATNVRYVGGSLSAGAKPVREDVTVLIAGKALGYYGPEYAAAYARTVVKEHGRNPQGAEAVGAWDDSTFAVIAYSERAREFLADLRSAMSAGDVAAWLGAASNGNPFARGGLIVAIASRVPEDVARQMLDADTRAARLAELSGTTGIGERLRASGKRYYELSPRFREEVMASETSHPVVYWLSPSLGADARPGWFTVEELDEWIEGRGPVMAADAAPRP